MTTKVTCTAHNRAGNRCGRSPIKGGTVCRAHGGATPSVKAAAARRVAEAAAAKAVGTYGLPREVAPEVALLEEVHRSAGHVAWLGELVGSMDPEALVWGRTQSVDRQASEFPGVDTTDAAGIHVWLDLYLKERAHLAKVSKSALDAGIAERQVQLAEAHASLLGSVIRRILIGLGIDASAPATVEIVSRELRAVSAVAS